MSNQEQPRVAKGTPKRGGQWSGKHTGEAGDVDLGEPAASEHSGWTVSENMFGGRVESHHNELGDLHDPPDGSPAVRQFHSDGTLEFEAHYQDSFLQDPPDGTPAARWYHPDGPIEYEAHYQRGLLQDPPDGTPAVTRYHPDGTAAVEEHYRHGQLVRD